MKKLIVLFMLSLFTISWGVDSVLLASGEWEPYASSKNSKGRIGEIIVEEAFKLSGVEVKFKYLPWKRGYEDAKNIILDGSILYIKNQQREKNFLFNEIPIINTKNVFFYKKGSGFDWQTLEDLHKYKIGSARGFSTTAILKDANIKVDIVNTQESNLMKLAAGRIDAFPANDIGGTILKNKTLSSSDADKIAIHSKPLQQSETYIIVSKKHPKSEEIITLFDEGMRQLKGSGRYEELLESINQIR